MAKHSEEEVEKNGKHSDLHESQLKRARLSLTQENEVNFNALPGSSHCTKEEDEQIISPYGF